ncbi:hypothetical protein QAD02_006631 [Eretmocerus hayati]|uniref:Uncharacterized protein n=1 Tax=Eretmocerus hayati TaxID=131215 RepID=A0ACC2N3T5_9HYME|nr:hypothetical protein QAD02_006631 [Eretmocerus hayati]
MGKKYTRKNKNFVEFLGNFYNANAEPLSGPYTEIVRRKNYNFVASLAHLDETRSRKDAHFCTGILISHKHILTNEHCISEEATVSDFVIYLGSYEIDRAKMYSPCDFITYDQYKFKKDNLPMNLEVDDVAIITLCKSVDSEIASPAKLLWEDLNSIPKSDEVMVLGWGALEDSSKPSYLKSGKFNRVNKETCERLINWRAVAKNKILCTVAKACIFTTPGDSGSPLMDLKNHVIGITTGTCFVSRNQPGLRINTHANTIFYKEFIIKYLGNPSN